MIPKEKPWQKQNMLPTLPPEDEERKAIKAYLNNDPYRYLGFTDCDESEAEARKRRQW